MTEHVQSSLPCDAAGSEDGVVARKLASSFGHMVARYREYYKLSPEDALHRTEQLSAPEFDQFVFNQPADQVSWFDLDHMAQRDPEMARKRWEEVKRAALEELQTGHRAAKAMERAASDCWSCAKFIALRQELAQEWQPRNGIERQLLDTMAQAQTTYLHWLETLMSRMSLESMSNRQRQEEGRWAPPRVTDAEAVEQAAAMVDRFNRIFLRTLRALRDLRRYAPTVIVQNAGQVNVGEQQVNFAPLTTRESSHGDS